MIKSKDIKDSKFEECFMLYGKNVYKESAWKGWQWANSNTQELIHCKSQLEVWKKIASDLENKLNNFNENN